MVAAVRALRLVTLFCVAACVAAAAASPVAAAEPGLIVEGTEFLLTTADGRVLRSADLVGATLRVRHSGRLLDLTIQAVEEDPDAKGGRVVLHRFVARQADGTVGELCAADAADRSLGFPVPDGRGGFALTCTGGAVGKCIRLGYRPWDEAPDGPPLRALHSACVRMMRADYGGDGRATSRDGMMIDVYDRFGIQAPDEAAPMTFEAGWSADGAVCVAHPRIPANISLEQLAERYPRLRAHLGPAACTEDAAMGNPAALLFNRSRE